MVDQDEQTQLLIPGFTDDELEAHRATMSATTRRLLDAHAEIYGDDPELAFLHSTLAVCGLPYRDPGMDVREFERRNGRASLLVTAGKLMDPKSGSWVEMGLPFGAKARIIMAYLCSEAIRTRSPQIHIGRSLCGFMTTLGISPTGGEKGSIAPFKQQLQRLIAAHMQVGRVDDNVVSQLSTKPIKGARIWFPDSEKRTDQIWDSTVLLDGDFFESLQNYALPLDRRAIAALTHSAMALDVYFWLTHRLHRVREKNGAMVSWTSLHQQFGQGYSRVRDFKARFQKDLRQALAVYPEAKIQVIDSVGLKLFRSTPPIPERLRVVTTIRSRKKNPS